MPVVDIFSKRQRRARGEPADVYIYDGLPQPLRVQIVQILRRAIGEAGPHCPSANSVYQYVHDTLAEEYGLFELGGGRRVDAAVVHHFLQESDTERALDVVELAFQMVHLVGRDEGYRRFASPVVSPDDVIQELNDRFHEHGVGYQFESGELIRIDSQLLHREVVRPALGFLRDPMFEGANIEYLRAHEHYRHGRNEEALADALKSFESVMKVICHKREWPFSETDTARKLVDVCFSHNLVPDYLQSQFSALRSSLESGVPTVRNKESAHGQGTDIRAAPEYLAAYLLHLTGANILLLVQADRSTT